MVVPGVVLENHTLVVRDGRILDIVPTALAVGRYAALAHIDRSAHLLLPGLVDAYAPLTRDLDSPSGRSHDHALLRIAAMVSAGTTTFCSVGKHPDQDARLAMEQGMRAVIGIPVGDVTTGDNGRPDDSLTRALAFRDEYRGHPNISTIYSSLITVTVSSKYAVAFRVQPPAINVAEEVLTTQPVVDVVDFSGELTSTMTWALTSTI